MLYLYQALYKFKPCVVDLCSDHLVLKYALGCVPLPRADDAGGYWLKVFYNKVDGQVVVGVEASATVTLSQDQ